ncbi:MAG: FAD-dependent oxidoreductase [Phycisphaerae bacterium]|nr:FAD-dependent oxidoreductase [Phycisphaerae bacterium]
MNEFKKYAFIGFLVISGLCGWLYAGETVLVEAEGFDNYGGWKLDQQFMDQMGSSYLLAHGLGHPVEDANTEVKFPSVGKYKVWVRTMDWVSPWKKADTPPAKQAKGTPGVFKVSIDGKELAATFGNQGDSWHWQDGGFVEIANKVVKIKIHDLTGFEGRCDAILFSKDSSFVPPNADPVMKKWRRDLLGIADRATEAGEYDLVVVGGGTAGICAAVSGARHGLKVALIQDRGVLGGNNSEEVRVHLGGKSNFEPYPHLGDIIDSMQTGHHGNRGPAYYYDNAKKIALVKAEKNISLFLNYRGNEVEMAGGKIKAVIAEDVKTGKRLRFTSRTFADCTGCGVIGFLAGADFEMTEKSHMGPSNLWRVIDTKKDTTFPKCPWALDLSSKPFPEGGLGDWFWESGFDHDPINKSEYIRDWNFRAMYGAWDALKNVKGKYETHEIEWAAYVAGKRESRRLLGDIILTQDDLIKGVKYADGCVPTSWSIDVHLPHRSYVEGFEGDGFISKDYHTSYDRPYWVPYRCLYSRNIENLFMAGRNISVTHEALGTTRVMVTTGMMGEIVGMAAAICKEKDVLPRRVYQIYLDELKEMMKKGDK